MKGQNASIRSNTSGKEWWGKRPYSNTPVSRRPGTNKYFKRQAHKIERQEGIKEVERQIIQTDLDEDILFDLMIWD
jgi:hypothetical protein